MRPAKIKICQEKGCRNVQTTKGHCRLHYLKNWKEIREEEKRKAGDRLNRYGEGSCKRHPDSYVDVIKRDLRREVNFDEGDGEALSRDVLDEILDDLGFADDTSLEKLLSNIKLDKDV